MFLLQRGYFKSGISGIHAEIFVKCLLSMKLTVALCGTEDTSTFSSKRVEDADSGVKGRWGCEEAISRYHSLQEIFSSLLPSCKDSLHFVNTINEFKPRLNS